MSGNEHITGTEAEIRTYIDLCDESLGLPWPDGEHIGGGRHVDKPTGAQHWTDARQHPKDKSLWAAKVLKNARTKHLTPEKAQALADAEATGVELGEDWKPTEAVGPEP